MVELQLSLLRTRLAERNIGIELSEGGETKSAALAHFDGPADVLIVAVKATALTAAAQSARRFAGPDTMVVPMLNGVPWWFVEGTQLRSVDPDGSVAASMRCAMNQAVR